MFIQATQHRWRKGREGRKREGEGGENRRRRGYLFFLNANKNKKNAMIMWTKTFVFKKIDDNDQ